MNAQYAMVPPSNVLGGSSARCVRCHEKLRPGQPRAVEIDAKGVVRCVECAPKSRSILAVEPVARAVYAACVGNRPLVRVYATTAAPYLGAAVEIAISAVEMAISVSGAIDLADGLRIENALLRSEAESLRRERDALREELRRLNDFAGDTLARGILGGVS